jgi:hypothetical protein
LQTDISNPQSYTDVVDLLVPELQKQDIFWKDYAVPGGTMRENFYAKQGQWKLPDDHPSAQYRWNAPKPMTPTDPLDGFRWHPPKVEMTPVVDASDPLSGYRWKDYLTGKFLTRSRKLLIR